MKRMICMCASIYVAIGVVFAGGQPESGMNEAAGSVPATGAESERHEVPEGFPITVTDGRGREVTFEEPPQRIVCFSSGCMRGLGPLVPGTDITIGWPGDDLDEEFTDGVYYPGFADHVVVLDAGEDINPEVVAAFEPDVIFGFGDDEIAIYGAIAPVFSEYDVTSIDTVFETFISYGRIVGLSERAEEIAARVRDRSEAYRIKAPGDATFMTVGNGGDGTLWLRTDNSSECLVLAGLAACNWPDPTGGQWWSYEATTEAILNLNPDVIYMANWSGGLATAPLLEAFIADPLIAEGNAARNGRIYNVDGYNNPTAAGVMALSKLLDIYIPLIYPDTFPNGPLTDEEVREIVAEGRAE